MNEIKYLPSGFMRIRSKDGLYCELSPEDVRKIAEEYERRFATKTAPPRRG